MYQLLETMTADHQEGYVWFDDAFYAGFKEDYDAYLNQHPDAKFVMKVNSSSPEELKRLASNLNNSNLPRSLK